MDKLVKYYPRDKVVSIGSILLIGNRLEVPRHIAIKIRDEIDSVLRDEIFCYECGSDVIQIAGCGCEDCCTENVCTNKECKNSE